MAFNLFGRRDKNPDPETPSESSTESTPHKVGIFDRMRQAVTRTRESLADSIGQIVALTREVDETTLASLGPLLLAADVGSATTDIVLNNLRPSGNGSLSVPWMVSDPTRTSEILF